MTLIKIIIVFIGLKFKEIGQGLWKWFWKNVWKDIIWNVLAPAALIAVAFGIVGAIEIGAWHLIHPESLLSCAEWISSKSEATTLKMVFIYWSFILPFLELMTFVIIYMLVTEVPYYKLSGFLKSNWELSRKIVLKTEE